MTPMLTATCMEKARNSVATFRIGERLAWISWDREPVADDIEEALIDLIDAPRFRQGMPVVIRFPDTPCSFLHEDLRRVADECWNLAEVIGRIGVIAKSESSYHAAQLLSLLLAPRESN